MEDKTMTADTPNHVSRRNFIKGVDRVGSGRVLGGLSVALVDAARASSRRRPAASSG